MSGNNQKGGGEMNRKVLFVDDDPNILSAFKRQLRKLFEVETAESGDEGLKLISSRGPFAVVVADMRMPGMDGVQFLSKVKNISPDTIRIMLTGNADLQTAINAVNEGNIFRFLTKPCPGEILIKTLEAGVEQYRLVTAEKELLERTLKGSVNVLTEILSLVNPVAFSRASRIKRYVRHIASKMKLPNQWQFELAAMLSQIGCVTLPPDILNKIYAQEPLSDEEWEMFIAHPSMGRRLLENIPRLEPVAKIIENQLKPFKDYSPDEKDEISLGAQILKVALDFDQLIVRGKSISSAIFELRNKPGEYNPEIVSALESFRMEEMERVIKKVKVNELNTFMIIDEDVRAKNGVLLVAKGQEVTYPVLELLRSFARGIGVVEPIRVIVLK